MSDTEEAVAVDNATTKIKLIRTRTSLSSWLTRHCCDVRNALARNDTTNVESAFAKLSETFNKLCDVNSEILNSIEGSDQVKEIEDNECWFEKYYQKFIDCANDVSKFREIKTVKPSTSESKVDAVETAKITDLHKLIDSINLPSVELKPFSGDPLEFQAFITLFDNLVDDKSIDDSAKLSRLLHYCNGSAYAAIKNCVLNPNGYKLARGILTKRFGDKHLIAQKIINELVSGKSVVNAKDLQMLSDNLKLVVSSLTNLDLLNEIDNQPAIKSIVDRCPRFVKNEWRITALKHHENKGNYPGINEFETFIAKQSNYASDPVYGMNSNFARDSRLTSSSSFVKPSYPKPRVNVGQNTHVSCPHCNGKHTLPNCSAFKALNAEERLGIARNHRLCFACLKSSNHIAWKCFAQRCKTCDKRHHDLLHENFVSLSKPVSVQGAALDSTPLETKKNKNASAVSNACMVHSTISLPLIPVHVNNDLDKSYCLLDSGSSSSFISKRLFDKLKIPGESLKFSLTTPTGECDMNSIKVDVEIKSLQNGKVERLSNVVVLPKLTAKYPGVSIDVSEYPYLEGVHFDSIPDDTQADLIIGNDHAHLFIPLDVRRDVNNDKSLFAILRPLGWVLSGKIEETYSNHSMIIANNIVLDTQIHDLWQIEHSSDNTTAFSRDEVNVLEFWDKNTKFDDGHFVVPIPWKQGFPNFPDNKFVAENRLSSLVSKLKKTDNFDKYNQNIEKLLNEGHAEPVPVGELNRKANDVWYIPHHGVTAESKPGKIRTVFDCAAKLYDVSLNNSCYSGPDLVNSLIGILLRFRQHQFAFIGDVESMFLQVRVPKYDRDSLRFLWLNENTGRIDTYRMTSHLFGGCFCSSSSTFALRRVTNQFDLDPEVRDTILNSFYVDDLLKSCVTSQNANDLIVGTRNALALGGFNLRSFVVNDSSMIPSIPAEDRTTNEKVLLQESLNRALGIHWLVSEDVFLYSGKRDDSDTVVTRRKMLSRVSSLFDPLGLVSPLTIKGRYLFQAATRLTSSWDEQLPDEISSEWNSWLADMKFLDELKFDRVLVPSSFHDSYISLHVFCDASEKSYGACAYIRCRNSEGKIYVNLISAKARVAPLKAISIPRLELSAAVEAVKLCDTIRRALEIRIDRAYFWTDSTIVLGYLQNTGRRFKTFVANRVACILNSSELNSWNHVKSEENPADILSRGSLVHNIPHAWIKGPKFLSGDLSCFDKCSEEISYPILDEHEIKLSVCNAVLTPSESIDTCNKLLHAYSSFYRLKKAVAWFNRFFLFLRGKKFETNVLDALELQAAENRLVKFAQICSFKQEIDQLQKSCKVNLSSKLIKLNPILKEGILKVGGRLAQSHYSDEVKYPIVLDGKSRLAYLIAFDAHSGAHVGIEWTMSLIRSRFWITGLRSLVKKVKQACFVCKKLYAAPPTQQMAELPEDRTKDKVRCFEVCGCDVFGPFFVKQGRVSVKRYGLIFSCLVVRAVHIELLCSLDAQSFVLAFMRFCARRSTPRKVYSDNGTNFVGGISDLRSCWDKFDKQFVATSARRVNVEWIFTTPYASHHNGAWERMIRSARRILATRIPSTVSLTDEMLHTIFCEVESFLNGRPLTKLSDDPVDLIALTPNHFLLQNDNPSLSWGAFSDNVKLRKGWKTVQTILAELWKRWLKSYLHNLQLRDKWHRERSNLKVGDLVLLQDNLSPRGMWPLGIVEEVFPGTDGLVRSVKVRTNAKIVVRPITKVILLETDLKA